MRRGREQYLEFFELGRIAVIDGKTGRMFELIDHRIKRGLDAVRRALEPQATVGILLHQFLEGENKARLANAGLTINKRQPALAGFDVIPASPQEREFLLAANQFGGFRVQRFETACGRAFSPNLPTSTGSGTTELAPGML